MIAMRHGRGREELPAEVPSAATGRAVAWQTVRPSVAAIEGGRAPTRHMHTAGDENAVDVLRRGSGDIGADAVADGNDPVARQGGPRLAMISASARS